MTAPTDAGTARASVDRPEQSTDRTQPLEQDRSLGELFSRLSTDFGELVGTQLELAKAELRQDLTEARRAAMAFSAGAVAALLALLMLSFAVAWGLAEVMEPGWAFLIVGIADAVVAGVLLARGRDRMREATPVAEQTIQSVKEDVEWARHQRS